MAFSREGGHTLQDRQSPALTIVLDCFATWTGRQPSRRHLLLADIGGP
jgi:hypothetical protein